LLKTKFPFPAHHNLALIGFGLGPPSLLLLMTRQLLDEKVAPHSDNM
jgi:hypothetical protein